MFSVSLRRWVISDYCLLMVASRLVYFSDVCPNCERYSCSIASILCIMSAGHPLFQGDILLFNLCKLSFSSQPCQSRQDGITVLPVCLVLLSCNLIIPFRTDSLADLVLVVKVFLPVGGFLRFTLLFGDDKVVTFQMSLAGFLLSDAALHFKTFCHHVLYQAHVLSAELTRFARLVVHPVLHDVGVAVWLPCGVVAWCTIMPFVQMDEDLQGGNTPTLMTAVAILPKLVNGSVGFAYHHALPKRRTATDTLLSCRFYCR